jgi:hypothetical protein
MLELRSEFLCELTADLDEPQEVGQGPLGLRRVYPVKGGNVSGPKINGVVLPGGADWILLRSDGVGQLDVRASARTDEGDIIYAYYRGILRVEPGIMERILKGEEVDSSEYYFRTTPVFETGSERYAWLNKIVAVGVGELRMARVRYKVYQIL